MDCVVDAWWMCVLNIGKLTISTSDNLEIERTYMDTPTVTEGPEKSWMGRRGGKIVLLVSVSISSPAIATSS